MLILREIDCSTDSGFVNKSVDWTDNLVTIVNALQIYFNAVQENRRCQARIYVTG